METFNVTGNKKAYNSSDISGMYAFIIRIP